MADIAVREREIGRKKSLMARREALWGILFLLPSLIGFVVFYWLPILAGCTATSACRSSSRH